jgi:hypothetical protein
LKKILSYFQALKRLAGLASFPLGTHEIGYSWTTGHSGVVKYNMPEDKKGEDNKRPTLFFVDI